MDSICFSAPHLWGRREGIAFSADEGTYYTSWPSYIFRVIHRAYIQQHLVDKGKAHGECDRFCHPHKAHDRHLHLGKRRNRFRLLLEQRLPLVIVDYYGCWHFICVSISSGQALEYVSFSVPVSATSSGQAIGVAAVGSLSWLLSASFPLLRFVLFSFGTATV